MGETEIVFLGAYTEHTYSLTFPKESMDKDSQDVHQVLNELKNKFQEMRKLISSMPGIGVSPEQQQQQLQNLREQVRTKNELLQKYKSLCMFEIPKE
ncbi:mediator of RNA polymerase II transcription subunit 9 isoform X2 [Corapipo altera]|uniref:mediator of RNA polymerase II transcription subunit 9 isoform X2 n=1 Tax=Corapipo altera TaxID=415028 RepID=UPI000FD6B703|nr:mediator of RNA polymerase II transcription subunit 9 isoform X2 [Corapipo altera]